jgi:hypothetical protein
MLMGHVMGDYILQPLIMAVKKSPRKPMKEATPEERPEEAPAEDVEEKKDPYAVPVGTAIFWSILHSLVYTTSVCLWLWTWRPLVFGLIFLTHWPIDFFSLGSKWLELIRGRTFAQAGADKTPFGPFNVGFTCLVYATVDNWWHIALMTPVVWVLSKGLI